VTVTMTVETCLMSETAVSVCILTDFCSFGIKGLRKTGKYEHMKPI